MDSPVHSRQLLPRVARFNPTDIKKTMGEVEGFNAKLAVLITSGVGTMACAYLFALITLARLPSAIEGGLTGANGVIVWFAQTFLQLVLLSIILVGQRVQSAASDIRAQKEFADTETILDRLDTKTSGGLSDVLQAIQAIGKPTGTPADGPRDPNVG
jgi:hypothetical protein